MRADIDSLLKQQTVVRDEVVSEDELFQPREYVDVTDITVLRFWRDGRTEIVKTWRQYPKPQKKKVERREVVDDGNIEL